MRRINLHDNPLPYDALSYVWGAPSSYPQKVLEIDQQQLNITPNLHSALSALLKSNFVGRIWVDAVCINQEDLLERGNQVTMMADIYRHATTVRIYLGPDLPLITRFFQYAERNPNLDIEVPDMITTLHISKEDLLCEYVDLIHRPWWARVWILQEYALA
ncbi:heterokaryon incompatibility, partial [Dendryphion nanum]